MTRLMRTAGSVALLFAVATLGRCTETSGVDGFFVVISNLWVEVGREDHTFDLNDVDGSDGSTEGEFTGVEFEPDTGESFDLTGSWENNRVTFTVQRGTTSVTYTANVTQDDPSELTFTGGNETLRLRKS